MAAISAFALVVAIAAEEREVTSAVHDPAAAAQLIALLHRGAENDWLAEFETVRTLPNGEQSPRVTKEGQRDGARVVQEPATVTTQRGTTNFVCQIVDIELQCLETETQPVLPPSEVVQTLVDTGVYVVSALPAETIAGEETECFRVFGTLGFEPEFGLEREYCLAADGVPMRTRVVKPAATDEQRATRVQRDPSAADMEALVTELEQAAREADS